MAFRFGALPDSSATARKIIHLPRILMASPDYLGERGTPAMPSDLAHHSVITVRRPPSPTFSFRKDGRVTSVRVDSQLAITINEGATASAVAGLAASSENSAPAELEAGKLVRVLPDCDFGLNALFVRKNPKSPPHGHLPTSFSGISVLLSDGSGQGIAVSARHSPQLLIQYLYPTPAKTYC